ncbi:hypothetical protein Scep_009786 [Stephania cephalantha]|uniref:Bromo domain-containing protein n=1 Tax=Stephania cephalantha TaxID=152367 RepID=A0AAP0JUU9_9MAGN
MKRKRGHKKAKQKQKQSSTPKPLAKNQEIDSPMDDLDSDNAKLDSPIDVEASTAAEAPLGLINPPPNPKPSNAESDGLVESRLGRVKVKLKSSSKMLEPMNAQLEEQSQGGTEKANSQREGGVEVEKMGDGANPVLRREPIVFYRMSKKAGSIKIKSSNGVSQVNVQGEETIQTDGHKGLEGSTPQESRPKEVKWIRQDPRYNEHELKASLGVIKKVMKMDAAEPFNIPVNPIDLGIPDYFDIIENPMDFGTICNNIETGNVYMNSEDVFRDVQYIWDNCYRYNNKGDYILDLMKRVKKNFTKYWTAAGLYSDQQNNVNDSTLDQISGIELPGSDEFLKEDIFGVTVRRKDTISSKQGNLGASTLKGSSGTESAQVETIASSTKQMVHAKGIKHKSRRSHGINCHKIDCQCAVCVVRRRRKEREEVALVVENHIEASDENLTQEFRLEIVNIVERESDEDGFLCEADGEDEEDAEDETFLENASSEDESLKREHSPDPVAVVDLEGKEEELKPYGRQQHESRVHEKQETSVSGEIQNNVSQGNLKQSQGTDKSIDEPNAVSRSDVMEDLGKAEANDLAFQQKEGATESQKLERKSDASQDKQRKMELRKSLQLEENHLVMKLCKTLFPSDCKNVWTGPHSLACTRMPSRRNSAMKVAMDVFMQ